MPPSAPSFCTCWGCKREPLCNRFEMASSQRRAVPLLFYGSTPAPLVLGGTLPSIKVGLRLHFNCFALWLAELHLKSAPSPHLPFPTPALCPQICCFFLLCVGERSPAGTGPAPECHLSESEGRDPAPARGGWDPQALAGQDAGALSTTACSKPRWLDGTATSWLCSWLFSRCSLSSSPVFLLTSSSLSRPWFSLLSGLPLARLKPSRRDPSCGKWSLRAAMEVLVHCWRRGSSPEARPGCS